MAEPQTYAATNSAESGTTRGHALLLGRIIPPAEGVQRFIRSLVRGSPRNGAIMNKVATLGASILLVASGCVVAVNNNQPVASNSTPQALMQADRDFAVQTHARGIEGWMSFYTPDAIRIRYRGDMVKGYDAIRRFDEPGISDTTTTLNWEPTDAYVFRRGAIGSTTGRYSVVSRKSADAGKPLQTGRYVTMWRLENGRWLVIMDTGYPDPVPPPK
jgi:ketosteroid isomerase-like protein